MTKPKPSEFNPYYQKYIDKLGDVDPLDVLREGRESMSILLSTLSEADSLAIHPPYTWNLKQVVGHLMDAERVFAYRALRIARGDSTPLAGFEENNYVKIADFHLRSLESLASEYNAIRLSTLMLFDSFDDVAFQRQGTANNSVISVRALAYILAGHELHHASILKQRLANPALTV